MPLTNTVIYSGFLAKARSIAELRSPSRDDGTIARILWKTGQTLRKRSWSNDAREAEQLLLRAYNAKATLETAGEGGEESFYDRDVNDPRLELEIEEERFDLLVPGYLR
jgi:hypothetical protein